jgi:release factor glutamine methyltransferase
MPSIKNTLAHIQKALQKVSGQCSLYEAEIILQQLLGCSRSELYASPRFAEIPDEMLLSIGEIINRRLSDEPLAYIIGSVYFHSTEISVTRDVLIPRPETEVLVETVLKQEQNRNLFFADIGTGSGAIAAVLLQKRQSWNAVATDISRQALAVAVRNVHDRAMLVCCDMFDALKFAAHRFDFIVCNPPYVSAKEMESLDKSVVSFEPHGALSDGNDGLDFYRVLARDAKKVLKDGGRMYCEIGCDQSKAVCEIFLSEKWDTVSIKNDLTGRPRVFTACSSRNYSLHP